MYRQTITRRWPRAARNRRSISRRGRTTLSCETLEARHLLSGNWVMDLGPANVVSAAGPDGSVYTARLDAGTYYLTRYDSNRVVDPTMSDVPLFAGNGLQSMLVDSSGIYVGGTFDGTLQVGETTLISSGDTDVFIAKFNGNGTYGWSQRFGGSAAETLDGFDIDASGNVFVTGNFGGTATFEPIDEGDPLSFTSTLKQSTAQFVFELDDSGDGTPTPTWFKQLQDRGSINVGDIDVEAGKIALVGQAERCRINGTTYGGSILVRINAADGSIDLTQPLLVEDNSFAVRTVVQHDGWIYVAGSTGLPIGLSAFVMRLGGDGWQQSFTSTWDVWPEDLAVVNVDQTPTLVVAGTFWNTTDFGDIQLTSRSYANPYDLDPPDVFVAEMNLDGSVLNARQLGGVEREFFAGLATHPAGRRHQCGRSTASAILSTHPAVASSILSAKTPLRGA